MPRRDFERAKDELSKLEDELRTRLCTELRAVAAGGDTLFFFTKEYNPHDFLESHMSKTSDELLQLARETIRLRKLLVLPTDLCVGHLFEMACIENADLDNPHRLGPIRRAAKLLSQIELSQPLEP
jgi:hypothetical protein